MSNTFMIKLNPPSGAEAAAAARAIDHEVSEIANGKRKPGNLSLDKLAILATYALAPQADETDAKRYQALRATLQSNALKELDDPRVCPGYNFDQTYLPEGLDKACDKLIDRASRHAAAAPWLD